MIFISFLSINCDPDVTADNYRHEIKSRRNVLLGEIRPQEQGTWKEELRSE